MRGLRSIIISAVALAALGGYIFFIDSILCVRVPVVSLSMWVRGFNIRE